MKKLLFSLFFLPSLIVSMEEKRNSIEENSSHRRLSSTPIPIPIPSQVPTINLPSKEKPIVHDPFRQITPRDYEKLHKLRYDLISKNLNNALHDMDEIKTDVTNLRKELLDTAWDAKNSFKKYKHRKKENPSREDSVDRRVNGVIKKINKTNDILDLIRLNN